MKIIIFFDLSNLAGRASGNKRQIKRYDTNLTILKKLVTRIDQDLFITTVSKINTSLEGIEEFKSIRITQNTLQFYRDAYVLVAKVLEIVQKEYFIEKGLYGNYTDQLREHFIFPMDLCDSLIL